MPGIRNLYIVNDSVIKVPQPKGSTFKAIPSLKNRSVLWVEIIYETKNRVPDSIWRIIFNRIDLDDNGQYELTFDELTKKMRNITLFSFQTPETLGEGNEPLPIPSSIAIPTKTERKALIRYIIDRMPTLKKEAAFSVQAAVVHAEAIHNEYRNLIIKAAKYRRAKESSEHQNISRKSTDK